MPPSTAWPTTPPSTTNAATTIALRRAATSTATTLASASSSSTPVSVRLPNSMYLWNPSACSTVGVTEPSMHSGQVGAPEATAGDPHQPTRHDDADLGHEVGQQDAGQPAGAAAGCWRGAGEVVLVLVTEKVTAACSGPVPGGSVAHRKNRRG